MNRILFIDDEEGIRIIYQRFHATAEPVFQGRLGMDVAHDINHGIEKIASAEYDAIITDLKFMGYGSDSTIKWISDNYRTLPPIIVLTGDEDIYTRRACMIAGASDFWTKADATGRPDLFFKAIYNRYLTTITKDATE